MLKWITGGKLNNRKIRNGELWAYLAALLNWLEDVSLKTEKKELRDRVISLSKGKKLVKPRKMEAGRKIHDLSR